MAKVVSMTEGKPLPLMIKFALPMIVGSALQMLYNIADSAVVGRMIGVDAFAAVGVAGNFNWMVFSVVLGLTQGFGTLIAQYFGAGDGKNLKRAHAMAWGLTLVLGLAVSLIAFFLTRPMMTLLQTPPEIIEDSIIYLQITFACFIFVFANNTAACTFRAIGNSQLPLYIMFGSGVINVGLNILLVQFTDLGVAAVAIATVISQALATAVFAYFIMKTEALRPKKSSWKYDGKIIKELMRLGGPLGLRNLVVSFGGIFMQYFVNGYGTNFIAGIAATKRLYALLEIIAFGLCGAAATFVAQNYGARRFDRIKSGVRQAAAALLISVAIVITAMLFFGRNVAGLLIAGDALQVEEVLNVAMGQIYCMLAFLLGLYMLELFQVSLQGMGNSLMPTLGGVLEMFIRIGSIMLLPMLMDVWGVYIAEVLAWPICALFYFISFLFIYKNRCQTFGINSKSGKPMLPEEEDFEVNKSQP